MPDSPVHKRFLHRSWLARTKRQGPRRPTAQATATPKEVRTAEYLKRACIQKNPPKLPAFRESETAEGISVLPMPLSERLKRNIVPRMGFCSLEPGKTVSDGVTSGNGHMNIEVTCDPYAEQILFHHESLLMPWKRPFEAPKAADVFPQVRQMVLDGKYQEAIEFAFKEMNKGPIKQNTGPHPTVPAFMMHLDFPKTASVKDYLRTVDFESSEVKVHWSDERGEWVRQTFTSRPDDVVVQLAHRPERAAVNARIALQRYSRGRRNPARIVRRESSGRAKFSKTSTKQRLIYKCRLDPSADNSGYAGVVRVVRNGGSARMDGDTLVIENASSVMLLTRIEWFADYSEDKVEALRQAVEQLSPDYQAILERHRKVQSEAIEPRHRGLWRRLSIWNVDRGTSGRSEIAAGLLARVAREDLSDGALLVHPRQRQISHHAAETNANINLQIAPGPQGDLREGMDAYFNWMESLAPDFRVNAQEHLRNARHTLFPLPDNRMSASRSITPTPLRPERSGLIPIGFPPEAGVSARSGITIW